MAIPVARVHLSMAHAVLPALLPTPPKWKMLPLLSTPPCPCVAAAILPKPLSKPSRTDSDERWDARKTTKRASAEPSASSSSSSGPPRSADSVRSSSAGRHGSSSSPCKNATSPLPPKPGRADSVERWDAHKKTASPASSPPPSLSSGSGTSSLVDTEEEKLWKPRAMYAGPGFVVPAPESSVHPMPTALFLVPVA